jgi:hypothetical protein
MKKFLFLGLLLTKTSFTFIKFIFIWSENYFEEKMSLCTTNDLKTLKIMPITSFFLVSDVWCLCLSSSGASLGFHGFSLHDRKPWSDKGERDRVNFGKTEEMGL